MQGEPGGMLTLGGKTVTHESTKGTELMLELLGEPDEITEFKFCLDEEDQLSHKRYRWGALTVFIPKVEYVESKVKTIMPGVVAGWEIDPAAGQPWPNTRLTGPAGIEIGTSLKTLKATFDSNPDWDHTDLGIVLGKPTYSILYGDPSGADFVLDESNKVVAIRAGLTCRS